MVMMMYVDAVAWSEDHDPFFIDHQEPWRLRQVQFCSDCPLRIA
jgi:hypothetical protein